ncbi:MAG: 5'-3' exonuclease [Kofleriaceae bacterium]
MAELPRRGAPDALYILDLAMWVHAVYHATAQEVEFGEKHKPVEVIAKKLVKLLLREPAFLIAAVDSKPPTWRHVLYPKYKAHRPPHPAGVHELAAAAKNLLRLHHIPVLGVPWFEADDVIATIADMGAAAGLQVVILARDKDLMQLVGSTPGPRTAALPTPLRGRAALWDGASHETVGRMEVVRRWGVDPDQLADFFALVGDGSDGIPGVDGIGVETAGALISRRGSLDAVLKTAILENKRVRRRLELGAEAARLSRKLVELRCDVPVEASIAACRVGWGDPEWIRAFYTERGLHTLAGEVDWYQKAPMPAGLQERARAAGWL